MAVASSPASKKSLSGRKEKKINGSSKKEKSIQKQSENGLPSSPKKRSSCPGVRVVGGRIYDSQNGKTCHQCRQKTMDFAASCKNLKQNKPCTIKFCHKCLLNRYGEKAEDVAELESWTCPKCRGICNCSFCMKKRGHQPTGILVHTAKATGFSSVSEMLQVKGPESCISPKKEVVVVSPKKQGKENSFDGKVDSNLHPLSLARDDSERKPKKMKQEAEENASTRKTSPLDEKNAKKIKKGVLKKLHDGDKQPHEKNPKKMDKDNGLLKENGHCPDEKNPNKRKKDDSKEVQRQKKKNNALLKETSHENLNKGLKKTKVGVPEGHDSRTTVFKKVALKPLGNEEGKVEKDTIEYNVVETLNAGKKHTYQKMPTQTNSDVGVGIALPQGSELTTVAGVDLPAQDIGNALQFLEFCKAFGKILDVKKGQAECVLRDLMHGRSGRRGKYSSAVQFHIQLLSVIEEDLEEGFTALSTGNDKNSWFQALKRCIAESKGISSSMSLDCLDRGLDGYDTLDSSKKLRLLNFVCDEALGTAKIRNWIDDQNSKFVEKAKETREKVLAAKNKEKHLKQKMQDDIAKAIIAKNGAPLSISEHDDIISQIKSEAAKVHSEMLESKDMLPKNNQKSKAVRTEPIRLDISGRVYWILKGYSDKSKILLQDVGDSDEKWFAFDDEQKQVIEKHINSASKRKLSPRIVHKADTIESIGEANV